MLTLTRWIVLCLIVVLGFMPVPALALTALSDSTINQAVRYGLENKDLGLSTFLGGNWREGTNGALLNIYTPFMEIARSAARRKNFSTNPKPEEVAEAREKIQRDIFYIWTHPTVKMLVSLYGDEPTFAREYFAVIEGVGRGRRFTIYPEKTIPQYLATKEENATFKPYTAINAYHFKFDDLIPLEEFTLKLYGKNVEPVTFRIRARDIQ